jgi:hypothetical protein
MVPLNRGTRPICPPDKGFTLHFVLPFGPETSGSKEDSVSKERFTLKGKQGVRKLTPFICQLLERTTRWSVLLQQN